MVARKAISQFDEFAKKTRRVERGSTVAHNGVQDSYASADPDRFIQ
jgi:hypothetical protein